MGTKISFQENCDLFFKDAPDGVNAIVVGVFGGAADNAPLALVGGNCSIQGFDHEGNEAYWTVTGDNVSTMTFCDVDEDGALELLVGSDDYEIRVFRNEEVVSETPDRKVMVVRKPIGVVACICPWNYPLFVCVQKLAPALTLGSLTALAPSLPTVCPLLVYRSLA